MANIVLTGDTSGAITVAAPAVAGTNTLTLPASTGTLLTTTGSGASLTGIPAPASLSTASGSAPSYSARAWVNFNGTGTVAIRASGNVSSITDHGTGDYTINFTTAMADVNYTAQLTTYYSSGGAEGEIVCQSYATAPTTSAFRIINGNPGTNGSTTINVRDSLYLHGAFFR